MSEAMTSTGEIRLIQRAAHGDSDAFAALFEEHFRPIYNYALWLCSDPDLAEDLTQDTFIRAHGSLSRLGPPWKIRPWLYRLVHNLFIDHTRRRRPVHPLEADAPIPSSEADPERQMLFGELSGPVRSALQRLNPQYREALVLREVEGFHYADIAEIMGVSVDNVKVMLHRARASFKDNYGLRLLVERPQPRCDVLKELLDAYRDKELTPEQEALVRAHIRDCASCKQRKRELAALLILFKAQPTFPVPGRLRPLLLKPGSPWHGLMKGGSKLAKFAAVGGAGMGAGVLLWLLIHPAFPPPPPPDAPALTATFAKGIPYKTTGSLPTPTSGTPCIPGSPDCATPPVTDAICYEGWAPSTGCACCGTDQVCADGSIYADSRACGGHKERDASGGKPQPPQPPR